MTAQTGLVWRAIGIAALAAPLALFLLLYFVPSLDATYMAPTFHFYAVSFTALAAAIACAVLIGSARTLQETRLLFLGLAFFTIAGVFAVHGLATPGFIVDEFYLSVSVSAWLSAAGGAGLVALSVVPLPHSVEHALQRYGKHVFALFAVAIFAYITLSMVADAWLDWVPIQRRSVQFAVGLPSLGLAAFAAWRYFQAYQFARLPAQLAMAGTLVLLLEVQVIILWGVVWHLSWWLYHGLYAAAFIVLFAGWAIEVRRAGTLRAIADALSMRDALAQLNRGLESPIVELVDAIEIKDQATYGHVRRVAGFALAIGRRLGLPPHDLRALVLAAEMHDVGKISVPDSILAKPGALTAEEFDIVKMHTERGYAIAQRVSALAPLAEVIRSHHERLDGSGYPKGMVGVEIPLLARIIAVADTYDALTSRRPYRDARSHADAMAEIVRVRGRTLDPACVDALAAELDDAARDTSEAAA
jgi:HD-GYP domain-containing protein (c-di-GMP phosphodiesterase class II)